MSDLIDWRDNPFWATFDPTLNGQHRGYLFLRACWSAIAAGNTDIGTFVKQHQQVIPDWVTPSAALAHLRCTELAIARGSEPAVAELKLVAESVAAMYRDDPALPLSYYRDLHRLLLLGQNLRDAELRCDDTWMLDRYQYCAVPSLAEHVRILLVDEKQDGTIATLTMELVDRGDLVEFDLSDPSLYPIPRLALINLDSSFQQSIRDAIAAVRRLLPPGAWPANLDVRWRLDLRDARRSVPQRFGGGSAGTAFATALCRLLIRYNDQYGSSLTSAAMSDLRSAPLNQVAISAQISPDGLLSPVGGVFAKIIEAYRGDYYLPGPTTFVVMADRQEKDLRALNLTRNANNNWHYESDHFAVILACSLEDAWQKLEDRQHPVAGGIDVSSAPEARSLSLLNGDAAAVVDLGTAWGLDRGSYVLVVAGFDPDESFQALCRAERSLRDARRRLNRLEVDLPDRYWLYVPLPGVEGRNYPNGPENREQVWNAVDERHCADQLKHLKLHSHQRDLLGVFLVAKPAEVSCAVAANWCRELLRIGNLGQISVVLYMANSATQGLVEEYQHAIRSEVSATAVPVLAATSQAASPETELAIASAGDCDASRRQALIRAGGCSALLSKWIKVVGLSETLTQDQRCVRACDLREFEAAVASRAAEVFDPRSIKLACSIIPRGTYLHRYLQEQSRGKHEAIEVRDEDLWSAYRVNPSFAEQLARERVTCATTAEELLWRFVQRLPPKRELVELLLQRDSEIRAIFGLIAPEEFFLFRGSDVWTCSHREQIERCRMGREMSPNGEMATEVGRG